MFPFQQILLKPQFLMITNKNTLLSHFVAFTKYSTIHNNKIKYVLKSFPKIWEFNFKYIYVNERLGNISKYNKLKLVYIYKPNFCVNKILINLKNY